MNVFIWHDACVCVCLCDTRFILMSLFYCGYYMISSYGYTFVCTWMDYSRTFVTVIINLFHLLVVQFTYKYLTWLIFYSSETSHYNTISYIISMAYECINHPDDLSLSLVDL